MTSAPQSPSSAAACGPWTSRPASRTRNPSTAPTDSPSVLPSTSIPEADAPRRRYCPGAPLEQGSGKGLGPARVLEAARTALAAAAVVDEVGVLSGRIVDRRAEPGEPTDGED